MSYGMAKNNYPIVFIHGFMGWGPEEMGNYSYWGGKNNYIKELEEENRLLSLKVSQQKVNPDEIVKQTQHSNKNTTSLFLKGRSVNNEIEIAMKSFVFDYIKIDSISKGGGCILKINNIKRKDG